MLTVGVCVTISMSSVERQLFYSIKGQRAEIYVPIGCTPYRTAKFEAKLQEKITNQKQAKRKG